MRFTRSASKTGSMTDTAEEENQVEHQGGNSINHGNNVYEEEGSLCDLSDGSVAKCGEEDENFENCVEYPVAPQDANEKNSGGLQLIVNPSDGQPQQVVVLSNDGICLKSLVEHIPKRDCTEEKETIYPVREYYSSVSDLYPNRSEVLRKSIHEFDVSHCAV